MVPVNFMVVLASALIPLALGMIWYHPKVFGNAWMKETGLRMDGPDMNMLKIVGVSLLVAMMMAMGLMTQVIHQYGAMQVLANEPGLADPSTEIGAYFANFMAKYGNNFRTFGHGALHGVIAGLFTVLPPIATSSLYERRSFKYVAISAGYWIVSMALMGGVICAFA
jgi:Protein of unknown function (DUF1761)